MKLMNKNVFTCNLMPTYNAHAFWHNVFFLFLFGSMVNSSHIINAQCSPYTPNILLTSPSPPSEYRWTAVLQTVPTGGTITGFSDCSANCGNILNQTLTNTGTTLGIVRYHVTPYIANIPGTSYDVDVTVYPLPTVAITGLNTAYCKSASPVILTGNPTGGIFKIDNYVALDFNPSVLSVGTRNVVYSYTDGNGCNNTTSKLVTVNALPTVTIMNLNSAYCKSDPTVTLRGNPMGGTFKIDGNTATSFNPSALSVGSYNVVYTYTDGNGCGNTTSKLVTINALPSVAITGLNTVYCKYAPAVTLTGNPEGGIFRIDGNVATSFDPAVLSAGSHNVVYTYSDGNSCSNTALKTVFVNDGLHIPDSSFAVAIRRKCPSCIDTCNNLTPVASTITSLGVGGYGITDLTGIEGFLNLRELYCESNKLTTLPNNLPNSLQLLYCHSNQLTALPNNLPNSLQTLFCHNNKLTNLPSNLPSNLSELQCFSNQLQVLPTNLPSQLYILHCQNNQLQTLPTNLPNNLQYLYCDGNNITCLPSLPNLFVLRIDENKITCLPQTMRLVYNVNHEPLSLPICTGECNSAVVPIELLNFLGYTEGDKNYLNWQTAEEKGVSHFDIERSMDGLSFEKIGTVKAKGSNSIYNFMSYALGGNLSYYRLRINPYSSGDEKVSYSKTLSLVNNNTGKKLIVYPNPVTSELTVQWINSTNAASKENFQIINLLGQVVMKGQVDGHINTSALIHGVYYLKIGTEQVKFMKE
jgi:Leucine-rich repeat (LRR) protein